MAVIHPTHANGASRRARTLAGAALLVAVLIIASATPPSIAAVTRTTTEDLAAAIAQRQTYGLPTDASTMWRLYQGGEDVGTTSWSFPMTAQEEAAVDLTGRMAFVTELDRKVLPFVRSLPTYAGAWIDQLHEGGLVVMLTALDQATEQTIRDLMPQDSLGLRFVATTYNQATLSSAADRGWDVWREVLPNTTLLGVGVDTIGNGLRFTVAASALEAARDSGPALRAGLGVPVTFEIGVPSADATCTSRTNCYNPMLAGIMIYRDYANNPSWYCTMGFQIWMGSDKQYLTAGHCGYGTPNDWYDHGGYGYIGDEVASWYVQNGEDALRSQIPDSQATGNVYSAGVYTTDASSPVLNETICASLGKTAGVKCGTVSSTHFSWISETGNINVWGARETGWTPIPGDSGSPIYRRVLLGGDWYIVPIGVMDHENGGFAVVADVLAHWGATIVTN